MKQKRIHYFNLEKRLMTAGGSFRRENDAENTITMAQGSSEQVG